MKLANVNTYAESVQTPSVAPISNPRATWRHIHQRGKKEDRTGRERTSAVASTIADALYTSTNWVEQNYPMSRVSDVRTNERTNGREGRNVRVQVGYTALPGKSRSLASPRAFPC